VSVKAFFFEEVRALKAVLAGVGEGDGGVEAGVGERGGVVQGNHGLGVCFD